MGENNDDDNTQKPPVHNPNNKKRVKPPPPKIPPPLTQVLGELENISTNAHEPISLFLAELKKQDKAARLENPTKAIQDAYQQMLNNGHKHQDFYKQVRHLVVEGVSVREAIRQHIAAKVGQFSGSYQPPPKPPSGVLPFREQPIIGVTPLPPPFVPRKEADLKADTLKDAARGIEQSMKQLYLERDSKVVEVKANIEKSSDGNYTATITFAGGQKPPQSRNFSRAEVEGYAKKHNEQNLEQLERAINAARTPIIVPKNLKKYGQNLDKAIEQFINQSLKDPKSLQKLADKHFGSKNLADSINSDPNLKSQVKYLLTIEYLQYTKTNTPANQTDKLQYLNQNLTQAGAMLRGSGFQPPEANSRKPAIAHSLQRSRSNESFVVPKTEPNTPSNTANVKPPRPGGRND